MGFAGHRGPVRSSAHEKPPMPVPTKLCHFLSVTACIERTTSAVPHARPPRRIGRAYGVPPQLIERGFIVPPGCSSRATAGSTSTPLQTSLAQPTIIPASLRPVIPSGDVSRPTLFSDQPVLIRPLLPPPPGRFVRLNGALSIRQYGASLVRGASPGRTSHRRQTVIRR